jgi:DNA-binding GntR family transcriptional regulator
MPSKRLLADDVVDRLRGAILTGQLSPEKPLRAAALAELMGVSRGPIREALRRLASEGLVLTGPTGRTYVARLSIQDLDEVHSLRAIFEHLAVEYACRNATAADLAELQSVINTMAAQLREGLDARAAAEADINFHDILYRASGHQRLQSYWKSLRPQIYIFMLSRNVASSDFQEAAVPGHQAILDAIQARDRARALDLIDAHLVVGYRLVRNSYV